jgi:MFS transporter, DHA1 family, inner membrane transport protein
VTGPHLLADFAPRVRRSLPWLVGFRWISNAGIRFGYSFLPAIARGTGLSVEEVGRLLALRDLTGLSAPAAGRLSDRIGTPRVMVGAGLVALGGLIGSVFGPVGLVAGFLAFGLGKIGFDTGLNAWVGHEIAYERRGRAMGLVELAWALSALLLLPVVGLLIDLFGWRAAPLFLAAAGCPLLAGIRRVASTTQPPATGPAARPTFNRTTVGMYVAFGSLTLASQFLIVGHGLWLEDAYRFDAAQIGVAVVAVGAVELVATIGSITGTDRLGKRPSIIGGTVVFGAAAAILAVAEAPPLAVGLAVLVLAFLGFEFAFVSALPLVAELDPDARATAIGIALGASTVIRSVGSVAGSTLYVDHGFTMLMTASALAAAITLTVTLTAVREPAPATARRPVRSAG